jgi:putative transposase
VVPQVDRPERSRVQSADAHPDARKLTPQPKIWWFGWLGRILAGGYDRIAGALANLGHNISDQTVGNILKRHGIAPAPKHSQTTTCKEFIRAHMAVLAGVNFFTVEVLTWRGLVTYYVLFFIHLESRQVSLAGMTRHPTEQWMLQIARNATSDSWGYLENRTYVLHDRDAKFCATFRDALDSGGMKPLALPPRSSNLNAFAERWVRSVKQECCRS